MSTILRPISATCDLDLALSAIGVAAPTDGAWDAQGTDLGDGVLGDDGRPEALLPHVRERVDNAVSVFPLEPGAAWPRRQPALVLAPDARSVVAVARTGARRSMAVGVDGRRHLVRNGALFHGPDAPIAASQRVGRTFAALRRSADPDHAPVVLTFPSVESVVGGKAGIRGALAGFMALTVVSAVAMLSTWGFAFAAVETDNGRGAALFLAIAAAAVAAMTRGASGILVSKVATVWSLRIRAATARQILGADPRRTRAAGELQLLAALSETENVDAGGIETALMACAGLISLALAVLLALVTFPWVLTPLLVAWLAATVQSARIYRTRNDDLVAARRDTGSWVAEQLRAHETRWVQAPDADMTPQARDIADRYDETSGRVDHADWLLSFVVPAAGLATMIAAVGTLAVVTDPAVEKVAAAVAVALISYQSVTAVAAGLASAARVLSARRAVLAIVPDTDDGSAPIEPPSELVSATTDPMARVVLTGPTGSGKTRLVESMSWSAARSPDGGIPGPKSPVLVPAFADNFMFRESLAFNLLLGRGWPAGDAEIERAERVARSVGLGDLIDRMPIGLHTPVGETGWQLSNGERTMVFVARALLSDDSALLVDDELDAVDSQRRLLVGDALATRAGAVIRTATLDHAAAAVPLASELSR